MYTYRETASLAHPRAGQDPPPPTDQVKPPVRPAHAIGAIIMLLLFPPIIGAAFGLGLGILFEIDLKVITALGLGAGVLVGAGLAAIWLVWVTGVVSMLFGYPEQKSKQVEAITVVGTVEDIRIVPYRGRGKLIDGVPVEDLKAFIDRLPIVGHTQRAWLGFQMPSGVKVDALYWQRLSHPLRVAGIIEGVSPRTKGYLTTKNVTEIKQLLGIDH